MKAPASPRGSRPAVPLASYALPAAMAVAHALYLRYVWTSTFEGRAYDRASMPLATPVVGTVAYLLFVLLGRWWMLSAGARAWDVRAFVHIYNFYICGLSAFMLVMLGRDTLWPAITAGGPLWATKLDETKSGAPLAYALWLNYHR